MTAKRAKAARSVEAKIDGVQPGDLRFVGGRTAHDGSLMVWCGELAGWARLRGVTGLKYEISAAANGSPTARITLDMLALQPTVFDALVPHERIALEVIGVTPAMRAAAEAAYERVMNRPARRRSRRVKGATHG